MGCNLESQLVGFVTGGLCQFIRHSDHARLPFYGCIKDPAGDEDFDPVRPLGRIVSDDFDTLFRRFTGNAHQAIRVAAVDCHAVATGQNPRSDIFPDVDHISVRQISITDFTHGADGRNPCIERSEDILLHYGTEHRLHQLGFVHLCRQVRRFAGVGRFPGSRQMDVGVDQTWHQVSAL